MQRTLKVLKAFAGKVFHDRKIMIVSEGKASTINISRNLQAIAAFIVVASLCWVPFSAGKIVAISDSRPNVKDVSNVEQRVEVLQSDILLLREYLRALHKYDNFELNRAQKYSGTSPKEAPAASDDVSELETQRNEILSSLKKRTMVRIVTIESFLKSAGLDYKKVTGKTSVLARNDTGENSGGPYIPANLDEIAKMDEGNDITTQFIDEMNYLFELQKIVNILPFSNPVAFTKVSSPFGVRHDPFNGSLSMHAGMDLQGPLNASIAATGPGKVTFSGYKGAYGKMVEVYHGYGYTTRYGHLSSSSVKPGDYVMRGQIIGSQGCSGRCTGDHVHYEVRVNDTPVNPLTYLRKAADIQYFYAKKL